MNKCGICGQPEDDTEDGELRPYGVMGSLICFNCMVSSPEREAEAAKQFSARLDTALEETGIAVIGGRQGPVPFKGGK